MIIERYQTGRITHDVKVQLVRALNTVFHTHVPEPTYDVRPEYYGPPEANARLLDEAGGFPLLEYQVRAQQAQIDERHTHLPPE